MRIPRSKGAVTGLLLVILGAWGALVPLVGPYFDWVVGSDDAWDWSAGRFWLSILPGAVTVAAGIWLMTSAHRAAAAAGAWLAILAGAWFVVGPTVSRLWNDGQPDSGTPIGGTTKQVLEQLSYFSALGAAIIGLGAFALGRMTIRSARDVELEHDEELAAERRDVIDRPDEGVGSIDERERTGVVDAPGEPTYSGRSRRRPLSLRRRRSPSDQR